MANGKLYLIPSPIADATEKAVIPDHVRATIKDLRYFLVEDLRTARRFLSSLKLFSSIEELNFCLLNKDTSREQLVDLVKPLLNGIDIGILSEAGCPGIADPGALAVEYAHRNNIDVVPLVGPSSLLLALMASGLSGQQFAFHGYLPIDEKEMVAKVKELEQESKSKNQTQLFIETPYRNNRLLEILLRTLHSQTRLCVAVDLTSPEQMIAMKTVGDWKKEKVELSKAPAVFLFKLD
jgi:16S rRNA (cytidine1402-2'-O)-methyltransferase